MVSEKLEIPVYSELEIALTPSERIYSPDRIYRVYWHHHFLRRFDNEMDCVNAIKWFKSFLDGIKYIKGIK